MKVEFLLARDDNSWDTVTVDDAPEYEPQGPGASKLLEDWFRETHLGEAQYRGVVAVVVYNIGDDEIGG